MHRFAFRNSSGETFPAYGIGRLNSILSTLPDGTPLYELVKPTSAEGIHVVNGATDVADTKDGQGLALQNAVRVLVDGSPVTGDVVGHVSGSWAATDAGTDFRVKNSKNGDGIAPVYYDGAGIASAGSGCCTCLCVAAGDITVDGIETVSAWDIELPETRETGEYGTLVLPAGTYTVIYDGGFGYWLLDATASVTAVYSDDSDATADLESDVACEIRFQHNDDDPTEPRMPVEVEFSGSVPNPIQAFSSDFSDDFA